MSRIDKHNYYLNIAEQVAARGTCLRRNYGAVIVKSDEIVSTGYVGAPRGRQNCCDIGKCIRNELNIQSGQRYCQRFAFQRFKTAQLGRLADQRLAATFKTCRHLAMAGALGLAFVAAGAVCALAASETAADDFAAVGGLGVLF
jgi:deoxycytidylate deaminase